MKLKLAKFSSEDEIVKEIQEIKAKIKELKKCPMCEENSLLLQSLDNELSKKIKYYIEFRHIV